MPTTSLKLDQIQGNSVGGFNKDTSGEMLIDPTKAPVDVHHFVTTTGGEYFFSPSIRALQDIGDGAI